MIPSILANTQVIKFGDIMPSYAGDIDYWIIAPLILIAAFVTYIIIERFRKRKN